VLGICVLVHLVTIVYAVRGGLSGAEILSRTQGHAGWFSFYAVFVLAVSVHVPIGLRSILSEWFAWRSPSRDWVLSAFSVFLALFGLRAVYAVFA
jgi:fumarate reductase subunit C